MARLLVANAGVTLVNLLIAVGLGVLALMVLNLIWLVLSSIVMFYVYNWFWLLPMHIALVAVIIYVEK